MKKFINNLANLPVAVSGLALGTAGIGNVLAIEIHSNLRYVCAAIAALILLIVAIASFRLRLPDYAHRCRGPTV